MCPCTLPGHVLDRCLCTCHGARHTLILIRTILARTKESRCH